MDCSHRQGLVQPLAPHRTHLNGHHMTGVPTPPRGGRGHPVVQQGLGRTAHPNEHRHRPPPHAPADPPKCQQRQRRHSGTVPLHRTAGNQMVPGQPQPRLRRRARHRRAQSAEVRPGNGGEEEAAPWPAPIIGQPGNPRRPKARSHPRPQRRGGGRPRRRQPTASHIYPPAAADPAADRRRYRSRHAGCARSTACAPGRAREPRPPLCRACSALSTRAGPTESISRR